MSSYLAAQIPTNGLVGYYPFNGNANDESGNGNNGIINGATLTIDRCLSPDSAYYFNGTDNYIKLPYTFDFSSRTIDLWFNTDNADYSSSYGAIYQSDNPNLSYGASGLALKDISGGKKLLLTISAVTDTFDLMPNLWYNVAMVAYANKDIYYYINGKLIGIKNYSVYMTSVNGLSSTIIGAGRTASCCYFQGKIDDILIYNRALNSTEILSIYNENCNKFIPDTGIINGKIDVCQGQKGVIYNVLNMDSIISYSWSYSGTGATINGTSDTIQIDFANNATSGNLTVLGNKISGNGTDTAILSITVNSILPDGAGIIYGDNEVCLNQNGVNYHTLHINNVSNYIWNYSGTGATIIGNSDSIVINFAQNATSGNLTVYGNNVCGNGTSSPPFSITVDSCNTIPNGQINIPNSFSPNGDGINEVFYIRGLTANAKLIIFDRFGRKVYESDNY